jgi:hypothetical protein
MKNSWDATLTIQEFWHDKPSKSGISSEMLGGLNHNFCGIQPMDNGTCFDLLKFFFFRIGNSLIT